MYGLATKALEDQGDSYPIWGTCLGFEFLAFMSNDQRTSTMSNCSANSIELPLNFTVDFAQSLIGSDMPENLKQKLTSEDLTPNYHSRCLTPSTFDSSPKLTDSWRALSTNKDKNGQTFISLIESKRYPFWGSQFHPELAPFSWEDWSSFASHSLDAVRASQFFSRFFVEQCRKNHHRFSSRNEEENHLIYNFNPSKEDGTYVYYF